MFSLFPIEAVWTPRNRFWRHIEENHAGLKDMDRDHFNDMQSCLQRKMSKETMSLLEEQTKPVIVDLVKDPLNRTILVEIGNAISPLQVRAIKDLANCTKEYFHGTHFEHRNFDENDGGNDCTFLNIVLQIFLPDIAWNVQRIAEMAYEMASWGTRLNLRPPGRCGLRTSEYLDYKNFKSLGTHLDAESIFTVLFALSDSKSYRGGEYYIRPRHQSNLYYFKPRQYSAIVFLSETNHGVTDIESGVREMFTNEFWKFDDPPWHMSTRPELEEMELFTKNYEELELDTKNLEDVDLEKIGHEDDEKSQDLEESGEHEHSGDKDDVGDNEYAQREL